MQTIETRFSPQTSGLKFINRFDLSNFMQFIVNIFRRGPIHIPDVVYGLCGGMVFTALDYYYAGKPVPDFTDPKKISTWLYFYLIQRQINSLSLDMLAKLGAWMLEDDLTLAKNVAMTEVPALRSSLDQQNPAPLVLIRGQGLSDPTHNHQVLAVGYSLDDTDQALTINLYDPNHPGEQPNLTLNLANPEQGIQIAQSTNEALRGFFVVHYDRHSPP